VKFIVHLARKDSKWMQVSVNASMIAGLMDVPLVPALHRARPARQATSFKQEIA
jgi:hypothetical protein